MVRMWWEDGVIYQVYVRSFQDSDGDGVGDLAGVTARLEHLAELGVAGLWLSPVYPSPHADFGYDISDYCAIDPVYGTLDDFDVLVGEADARGLRVVMDLVLSHTSIEHPWFREHPGWYVRVGGPDPPNNWLAMFGGSAWSRDPQRGDLYLHTFYPEQPDLDWRNPEVVRAMQDVVRFWLDRGVDGFRLDAVPMIGKDPDLRDDPPATEPFPLPLPEEYGRLAHVHSANHPDTAAALAAVRDAAGDALLVAEAYLPSAELPPYLEHVDLVFPFEVFHSAWSPEALARTIREAAGLREGRTSGVAWVLSNHDFGRLATRFGEENARVAVMLLLTLPGTPFLYQGDEIGMTEGPGGPRESDRAGRDAYRHPMQWDRGPGGGFTTGAPWLPVIDPERRNVAAQRGETGSVLELCRSLIALRRELRGDLTAVTASGGLLSYRRDTHTVVLNFAPVPSPLPVSGELVLATRPDAVADDGRLAARAGAVVRLR
jgi:alpha-glucosidase